MLEALGNLGDFIGGLAVVVTLAYLAVQVRQNTHQLARTIEINKAASYQNLTSLIVEANARLATNREIAELRLRGQRELASLDEVDRSRFLASASSMFRIMENLYQQNAAGLLPHEEYASWQYRLRTYLSHPGFREAWSELAPSFSPAFRDLVVRILKEAAA